MSILLWLLLFLVGVSVLAFNRPSRQIWSIGLLLFGVVLTILIKPAVWFVMSSVLIIGTLIALVNISLLRLKLTDWVLKQYRKAAPKLSDTEQAALLAGDVGWEQQFFIGQIQASLTDKITTLQLTEEEQAFLQHDVHELCEMTNDWSLSHIHHTIPDELWNYAKKHGFFGLVIPKAYGGKAFSPLAHAEIISKIATVSGALATAICVPNSLGPAELLLAYGTEAQKKYYLPRLASGEEVPCFALTSPVAGSDANAIEDYGVVCKIDNNGQEELAIRLNWDKRYITLAPVATLIGLAFKLFDPEHLLGDQTELGITCALIPANTPGITIGRRHYPLCSAFPNGPTQGKDVIISVEQIIGGKNRVGQGWKMLMECLAAGRGISLPSVVAGGAKRAFYTTTAYARIRRQFNTYIGAFDGIKTVIAEMSASLYLLQALRLWVIAGNQQGIHSAISSAISKYHCTELARRIIQLAMDVQGGKGICMGEKNSIAQSYIESPISITVEGANILTRSLIIFGQGAIRCHPYFLKEIQVALKKNDITARQQFDQIFWSHLNLIATNKSRAFLLSISRGYLVRLPSEIKPEFKKYYRKLVRFTAIFAFLVDISSISLGTKLKRKEQLSARIGDLLSYLLMVVAVFSYYRHHNHQEDKPIVHWTLQFIFHKLQETLLSLIENFPQSLIKRLIKMITLPKLGKCKLPTDHLTNQVADLMLQTSPSRSRLLTSGFVPNGESILKEFEQLDEILRKTVANDGVIRIIEKARREGKFKTHNLLAQIDEAKELGLIDINSKEQLARLVVEQQAIIHVDDFSPQDFMQAVSSTSSQQSYKSVKKSVTKATDISIAEQQVVMTNKPLNLDKNQETAEDIFKDLYKVQPELEKSKKESAKKIKIKLTDKPTKCKPKTKK